MMRKSIEFYVSYLPLIGMFFCFGVFLCLIGIAFVEQVFLGGIPKSAGCFYDVLFVTFMMIFIASIATSIFYLVQIRRSVKFNRTIKQSSISLLFKINILANCYFYEIVNTDQTLTVFQNKIKLVRDVLLFNFIKDEPVILDFVHRNSLSITTQNKLKVFKKIFLYVLFLLMIATFSLPIFL